MTHLLIALNLILQSLAPTVDPKRVEAIASDMVETVKIESSSKPNFHIAPEEAAYMLAAVAVHESGLLESVETCKNVGDGGRSLGLGQVMRGLSWGGHTKAEICTSRKLQLQLSLRVLDLCWEKTPQVDATFRCYTAGSASINSYAARHTLGLYKQIKKSVNEYADDKKVKVSFLN